MKQVITIASRIDNIDVDLFTPDNWDEKKLIICCHGFNSGKDSPTYVGIGNKLLANGIAYAIFSLPYHAGRRGDHSDFTVENCIEDIDKVEQMLRDRFPNTKIGILATSFGGYLTLLRLHKTEHNYFAIILKSPAIKMDEILKNIIGKEGFEFFKNQGFVINDMKEPHMRINFSFYEELANNRVFDNPLYDEKILIYHGMVDDTAPYKDSVEFANLNPNTTLVSYENENHRFSEEILDQFSIEVAEYCKKL